MGEISSKINNGMKNLKQFISEGLSKIVFHSTSIQTILKILRDDKFQLTPSVGWDNDVTSNKKYYYLSTSRDLSNRFTKNKVGDGWGILVLDGDKLNQTLKSQPVNYWGDKKDSEAEDRVLSDNSTIQNATKYIKEIHLIVGESGDNTSARRILLKTKLLKIGCWVYENSKDALARNKTKAINILSDYTPNPNVQQRFGRPVKSIVQSVAKVWTDFVYQSDFDKLTDRGKTLVYRLQTDQDRKGVARSLDADIHNFKSGDDVKVSNVIIDAMKKIGARTTLEFLEKVNKKWLPIIKQR